MSETTEALPREPLNLYTILAVMLEQISGVAWQKLGLQHDPITGTLEKDLVQARAAIDVAESVARALESQLDDEDRRQVQNLIRDLKVNFVEQSK